MFFVTAYHPSPPAPLPGGEGRKRRENLTFSIAKPGLCSDSLSLWERVRVRVGNYFFCEYENIRKLFFKPQMHTDKRDEVR
jgi:hypothetical protein